MREEFGLEEYGVRSSDVFVLNSTILEETVQAETNDAFDLFQRIGIFPDAAEIKKNVVANLNFKLAKICDGMKYKIRDESKL